MDVILLEKVAKLGALGDKVTVKSGYGRNFLIPQKKAVPATAANLESFDGIGRPSTWLILQLSSVPYFSFPAACWVKKQTPMPSRMDLTDTYAYTTP